MNYLDSPHLKRVFDFDILHMEWNTALYTLVLILIVMYFLNTLLFKPILRTLENRAKTEADLKKSVEDKSREVEQMTAAYEKQLENAREEVARVRSESHKDIQQAVEAILSKAREQAKGDFDKAMDEMRKEVDQARVELSESAKALAEQTANRILGA